jgi:16S rRNA (uracil1498-N3)-methyltransferase
MNWEKENFYLNQEYLSNIELYYTPEVGGDNLELTGDECKHITKVMRHSIGDTLHVTDGSGNYYETNINEINKSSVIASIKNRKKYYNEFENIYFCFPRLKNSGRFEFELEKSIELGITNFLIINTERTIPKGEKLDRWNKISLAAMKQSLRTHLPKIEYLNSIEKLNRLEGEKIVLDQNGDETLTNYLNINRKEFSNKKFYFIFGPEGGLSKIEIAKVLDNKILTLTKNRLRAETAVISTATAISLF